MYGTAPTLLPAAASLKLQLAVRSPPGAGDAGWTWSGMGLISLEHSKPVYWADFVLHGCAALALTVALAVALADTTAPAQQAGALALLPLGMLLWTLVEYLLHRFVLHGLQPFSHWHALHHQRPHALICGPTLLSAALLLGLVYAPLRWALPLPHATALTLGVLLGYIAYGLTHHATHHWRASHPWLRQRKHWHALHHHSRQPGCYGVTTRVWDRLFATALSGPGLRLADTADARR
jgi:xanthosine utilization system XapX-like protein